MYAELYIAWSEALMRFSQEVGLPVEWENRGFEPPGDGSPFLRQQEFAVDAESIGVGTASRHKFILQVSVYVRDNTGIVKAKDIADQIAAQFPVLHEFVTENHVFQVTKPATPAAPVNVPGWMAVPVSLEVTTLTP